MKSKTLKLLWVLIEVAASVRAALATFAVTMHVSNGDIAFSAFTTIVIEIAFLVSLFSIGQDSAAPIAAFLALAFSGAMQYLEVVTLGGSLSEQERTLLRAAIAFAPIIILGLSFVRRVVDYSDVGAMLENVTSAFQVSKPRGDKVIELPSNQVTRLPDAGPEMKTNAADVETLPAFERVRERKCSECGQTFQYRNAKQQTCSDKCRVARSRRLSK